MEKIKKFFHIETEYRFEWNDLRALLMLINVALIVFWSFNSGAIFGLIVASLGLLKDLLIDRHLNGMVLHLASMILNVFILCVQGDGKSLFFLSPSSVWVIRLVRRKGDGSVSRLVPSGSGENVFIK